MATVNMLPSAGGARETVLWTNPNPSANFASQTVNLSQSAGEFRSVRVYYRFYNNIYEKMYTEFSLDDSVKGTYATQENGGRLCIGLYHWAGYDVARVCYFTDYNYNKLVIGNCTRIGASATQNGSCVPLKVVGVK